MSEAAELVRGAVIITPEEPETLHDLKLKLVKLAGQIEKIGLEAAQLVVRTEILANQNVRVATELMNVQGKITKFQVK